QHRHSYHHSRLFSPRVPCHLPSLVSAFRLYGCPSSASRAEGGALPRTLSLTSPRASAFHSPLPFTDHLSLLTVFPSLRSAAARRRFAFRLCRCAFAFAFAGAPSCLP